MYPKYRLYFTLLNGEGALGDIEQAEENMLSVLKEELFYLSLQQIFVTILSIVVIGEILPYLNLGFTSVMIGLFRILCVGYGLYAIGNALMLFLLYFSNYKSALITAASFLVMNTVGTWYTIVALPEVYYGFGFLAAGVTIYLLALVFLAAHSKHIDHFVFSTQPIFFVQKRGLLTRLARKLDQS